MFSLGIFIFAYILDLIFGDPYHFPHIIRLIGRSISFLEKQIRKIINPNNIDVAKREIIGGAIMSIGIILLMSVVTMILLRIIYSINIILGVLLETFICYQMLATKSLKDESMKVYYSLKENDIQKSRYQISMIVGRDTENLDEEEITKAAVETVAENTADGIIAPMFYMMIGGATLAIAYKTINTLDSMIGYKNDKYIYFGKVAAKLDDIASYIPARLSAYLMIIASYILRLDSKGAYKIYNRDKYNHASPNSAHTEAVAAGALGIQLAGDTYYFGKLYKKPTIGDKKRKIEIEDIKRVNKLLYVVSFLNFIIGLIIIYCKCVFLNSN